MKLASFEKEVNKPILLSSFYISFSDVMLLLGVFFVMLLSMSKIEIGSFEQIRTGFTGSQKGTLVELAAKLTKIVKKDPGIPGVKVRLAKDGVRIDLDTAALFDTGSAVVKKDSLVPLMPLFKEIRATRYLIDVEGHTDDRKFFRKKGEEIETNWSLSGRRASSVIYHLLNFGFSSKKLRIVGYASTKPISPVNGKTEAQLEQARTENRRVSLLVR